MLNMTTLPYTLQTRQVAHLTRTRRRAPASSQPQPPLSYSQRMRPQPLILRLGDRGATAIASGAWQLALHSRLRAALDTQLRATHQRIGQPVWVAGYDASRLMPWGERATAAASYGESHGHWGRLPQPLTAALPTAPATPPWWEDAADRECPVCIDTMTEPWPSPEDLSRAPPGRWACSHAICRGCDARTQHAPNDRCPLCRAPRKVRMRP